MKLILHVHKEMFLLHLSTQFLRQVSSRRTRSGQVHFILQSVYSPEKYSIERVEKTYQKQWNYAPTLEFFVIVPSSKSHDALSEELSRKKYNHDKDIVHLCYISLYHVYSALSPPPPPPFPSPSLDLFPSLYTLFLFRCPFHTNTLFFFLFFSLMLSLVSTYLISLLTSPYLVQTFVQTF